MSSKVRISWGHREDKEYTTPCLPQSQGLRSEDVPCSVWKPAMLQPTGPATAEEKPPTAPVEPPHSQEGSSARPHTASWPDPTPFKQKALF